MYWPEEKSLYYFVYLIRKQNKRQTNQKMYSEDIVSGNVTESYANNNV